MYLRLLKKDLLRKKTMNVILLIFIVLCTTFLSSSINNLYTTVHALDFFAERTKASDYIFITMGDNSNFEEWIEEQKVISDYEKNECITVNLKLKNKTYSTSGTTVLVKAPEDYNLILDGSTDQPLTSLKEGEIAIPYTDAQKNKLKIGDIITVTNNNKEKKLTIASITKDMPFGNSYMGFTRLLISEEDFSTLNQEEQEKIYTLYSLKTDDIKALEKSANKETLPLFLTVEGSQFKQCYLMDMVIASVLIIVSICLITIALVILHFTIGFTIQEESREIGVMKAIGLKNLRIKSLYMLKYFILALFASLIGIIISIPFGNFMTGNIQNSVAMESASQNIYINILIGLCVVILVMLFCYLSTGKINKFSAIQAIRRGASRERYKNNQRYHLHKHTKAPASVLMAVSDILSNFKSYLSLIITFTLGTLLIILPLNAANTLKSDEIVDNFSLANSDFLLSDYSGLEDYFANGTLEYMQSDLERIEQKYKDAGLEVTLYVEYMYAAKVYQDDPEACIKLYADQAYNFEADEYLFYLEGSAPMLPNEIAMTELSMEKLGVSVGDHVNVTIDEDTTSYLITASYETMNNMGQGLRFASSADIDFAKISGFWGIQGNFKNSSDKEADIKALQDISDDCKVETPKKFISTSYLGSILDSMESLKKMILAVVLFINCLITILLTRTFITKDTGEIALLKSIGFRNRTICTWQTLRIIIVLIFSIIIGILLSYPMNKVVVKLTFGMMGARKIQEHIIAYEVYGIYPAVLFIVTSFAALISARMINKIDLKELRNID